MTEEVSCQSSSELEPGITYPLQVNYCGECSLPVEYCENGRCPVECQKWLHANLFHLVESATIENKSKIIETEASSTGDEQESHKKKTKRGGKGTKSDFQQATLKQDVKKRGKITVQRAPRGKSKSMTVVKGLGTCGIDVKNAAKFFACRFACGSSVTGPDEIVVQGDVKDEMFDLIPGKWPELDEKIIEDLGDQKR